MLKRRRAEADNSAIEANARELATARRHERLAQNAQWYVGKRLIDRFERLRPGVVVDHAIRDRRVFLVVQFRGDDEPREIRLVMRADDGREDKEFIRVDRHRNGERYEWLNRDVDPELPASDEVRDYPTAVFWIAFPVALPPAMLADERHANLDRLAELVDETVDEWLETKLAELAPEDDEQRVAVETTATVQANRFDRATLSLKAMVYRRGAKRTVESDLADRLFLLFDADADGDGDRWPDLLSWAGISGLTGRSFTLKMKEIKTGVESERRGRLRLSRTRR
jgi:hypothetical protein